MGARGLLQFDPGDLTLAFEHLVDIQGRGVEGKVNDLDLELVPYPPVLRTNLGALGPGA